MYKPYYEIKLTSSYDKGDHTFEDLSIVLVVLRVIYMNLFALRAYLINLYYKKIIALYIDIFVVMILKTLEFWQMICTGWIREY